MHLSSPFGSQLGTTKLYSERVDYLPASLAFDGSVARH